MHRFTRTELKALSLEELDQLISELDDALALVKRLRRPKAAAAASALSRQTNDRQLEVWKIYAEECATGWYGARKRTALRLGISERHTHRLLQTTVTQA